MQYARVNQGVVVETVASDVPLDAELGWIPYIFEEKPTDGGRYRLVTTIHDKHVRTVWVAVVVPISDLRRAEYPPIGDQLDALWKLIKANADKIDLAEAAPLLEAVQAVKDKYPKPS